MYSSKKLSMSLLPKVSGLQLKNVAIDAKTVSLSVASTRLSASCPLCGHKTARLHSHYRRTVAVMAVGRTLGKALAAGQEVPLLHAGVSATNLRRAPGFRGRTLRPQDNAPAGDSAAGRLH